MLNMIAQYIGLCNIAYVGRSSDIERLYKLQYIYSLIFKNLTIYYIA